MTCLVAFMLAAVASFTATEAALSRSWLAAATVAALGLGVAGSVIAVAFAAGAI